MQKHKHNASSVAMPAGISRSLMKILVQARPDLDSNCRAVLMHALDQAPGFVLSVGDLRSRLSWGEHRWVTTRKKLQEKGLLVVSRTLLANKSSFWSLNFDLRSLVSAAAPGDHARAHACVCTRACTRVIPPKPGDLYLMKHTPPGGAGGAAQRWGPETGEGKKIEQGVIALDAASSDELEQMKHTAPQARPQGGGVLGLKGINS